MSLALDEELAFLSVVLKYEKKCLELVWACLADKLWLKVPLTDLV